MSLRTLTPVAPAAAPSAAGLVGHDHTLCVQQALSSAERLCADDGARLTPLRRRVLELVWASHKPLGAYELLDQLTREGHKPAPPTIYRALDFLLEHRLIHRLSSLNAYLGCSHPGDAHAGYFLICQGCGNAEELMETADIRNAIHAAAQASGFTVQQGTLELSGRCRQCRQAT